MIIAFMQFMVLFKEQLSNLATMARDAGRNLAGVTLSKEMMKSLVVIRSLALSGKLVAFASAQKNYELKKAMKFSKTKLNRQGAGGLCSKCKSIMAELIRFKGELKDYQITDADIAAYDNLVTEYEQLATATTNAASSRKAQNLSIIEQIAEIKTLLKEQLDGMMLDFKETDKVFYDEYTNNRDIRKAKTSPTKISGTSIDGETQKPIKNVLISVVDTNYFTNSKKDGRFDLRTPQPGTVTLEAEVFGYEKTTITGVEVKLGKTTELTITLKPIK